MQIKKNLRYWEFIPRMSSTVIYDGCNSTEAWTSLAFPRLVTILAESKRKKHSTLWIIPKVTRNWKITHRRGNKEHQFSESHSPPQQKPATPTAEKPLLFKASITGFAASKPSSYKFNMHAYTSECITIYKQFTLLINLKWNK